MNVSKTSKNRDESVETKIHELCSLLDEKRLPYVVYPLGYGGACYGSIVEISKLFANAVTSLSHGNSLAAELIGQVLTAAVNDAILNVKEKSEVVGVPKAKTGKTISSGVQKAMPAD